MFNERLREIRKNRKMRQEDLAKLLGVGKSTIAGYEKGFRQPKLEVVNKLAKIFNTSTDYLLGITDNPIPKEPITDLDILFKKNEREYEFKGKPVSNEDLEFFWNYLNRLNTNNNNNTNNSDNTNDNDNDNTNINNLDNNIEIKS
ncbi:helix-turn-helix transcriptional regulator [Peribacillus frigoritolerans]|uniref:helix-turn-helix domain-containing protein n=1 Tax=Peribacillus frigoritolerans TaxID=450367 RepID=UPI0021CFEE0D|nr:helix-turn-helix transcriptional regulator [Peribacillus frigoritolerans]MCU6603792.1 helix-turn-helix transcriptional regulator [Peribacillus frigoritolerans]